MEINSNTFICNQSIFNDIEILDSIKDKNIFSISLSCGGCRSYCISIGIMRAIFKNTEIDNKKIPYISSVSGSSWLTMILSHSSKSLEEILLFDIDRTYDTFPESLLLDISVNMKPESHMLLIPFIGTSNFANMVTNKFILQNFDIHDKKVCKYPTESMVHLREEWPTYIISSTYSTESSFYPIEYTPNYSLIGGENVTLLINNLNTTSIEEIKKHVNEELYSTLEHNGSCITTTNIVTSSSFVLNILPSITSYKMNICGNNYNILDGAYMDAMAIVPLLRRKCKKIFSVVSCTLNSECKLDIKTWINNTHDYYEDIFDIDQWNEILENANKRLENSEICYWRGNINIKNNSYYHTEEYTPEIIFFFITNVTEFINTLPILVSNSPEMKNFPNFSMLFENRSQILAYTKLQSYALTSYAEWSFNKIFNENSDFFSTDSKSI